MVLLRISWYRDKNVFETYVHVGMIGTACSTAIAKARRTNLSATLHPRDASGTKTCSISNANTLVISPTDTSTNE